MGRMGVSLGNPQRSNHKQRLDLQLLKPVVGGGFGFDHGQAFRAAIMVVGDGMPPRLVR